MAEREGFEPPIGLHLGVRARPPSPQNLQQKKAFLSPPIAGRRFRSPQAVLNLGTGLGTRGGGMAGNLTARKGRNR